MVAGLRPSASAIAGFVLPNASWIPTFNCAGVAPLSRHARSIGNRMPVQFDRDRDETAFRLLGNIYRNCACGHQPFGFEGSGGPAGALLSRMIRRVSMPSVWQTIFPHAVGSNLLESNGRPAAGAD